MIVKINQIIIKPANALVAFFKKNKNLFVFKPLFFLYGKIFHNNKKWKSMPSAILIELTNTCNFSCSMCTYKSKNGRKKGFMDSKLFELALDRCEEAGIKEIWLFTVGESLLHSQFMNMWRLAVARSFKKVLVCTNGSLLNEEIIPCFLERYNSYLIFSFTGWNKESYEKIYSGGSFEDSVRKLKFISRIVREKNIPSSSFTVNCVFTNEEEMEKTKEFLINTIGMPISHFKFAPINYWTAVEKDNIICNDSADYCMRKKRKPLFCHGLNDWPGILFDGRVTACGCHAYDDGLMIGNIHSQSLKQIRRGPEYKKILNKFKRGDLRGLKCYGCREFSSSSNLSKIFADKINKSLPQ